MTITDSDVDTYQSAVSDFVPQIKPDGCYPTAIKNIIDELAERKEIDGISLSLSDVNDLCNYREGMYTEEEIIPEAVSREVSEFGYQAVEASAPDMDFSELQRIIENPETSLPVVELDPEYFGQVENYRVQGREEASHTVIVFKINSDKVLYYDPYEKFFEQSSRIDEAPYEWQKTDFYELWSGRYDERWAFWLEPRDQSLLNQFGVQ
jgi:hypothetical protein